LEGLVVSMPRRRDEQVAVTLRASGLGRVSLVVPDLPSPVALGDRLRVSAELRPPPGSRNPGGRDRAALLARHGVALEGWARAAPARLAPASPLSRVEAARMAFGREAARLLPAAEAAVVRAVGAGDESGLPAGLVESFARSGLVHVLSVSGLHLAVVVWAFWRLTLRLLLGLDAVALRVDARRWAAAICLPVVGLYSLATGGAVPTVRSGVGAALVLAAVLLRREARASGALALAALLLLAAEPGALGEISFQLSFASVAGLLLLSAPLRRRLPLRPDRSRAWGRASEAVLQAACASAAATLATAPLLALHFRRLSLLAVPANAVGLPLASALTVLATIAFLASAVAPALAPPVLHACRPLATALLAVNDAFAAPAWSTAGIASPGWLGVALASGLGISALALRGRARALCALGSCAALALPGPARRLAARQRGGLEVVFLSVGQGDASILRLPDGTAVLVDAGGDARGRHDPGGRDVLPLLRDMGVRRVAAAFLSHEHADHVLGLEAVAAALPVARIHGPRRAGAGSAPHGDERRNGPWSGCLPWRRSGPGRRCCSPASASRSWGRRPPRSSRPTTPPSCCASCTATPPSCSRATSRERARRRWWQGAGSVPMS
jgi:competence protein ComEC